MSSIRPITDFWILARSKTKYFGAYPSGFLERARTVLVGANRQSRILHVCGGEAKKYNESGIKCGIPLWGFGENDTTLDIDPECNPDILFDARDLDQVTFYTSAINNIGYFNIRNIHRGIRPDAIIIDRPYLVEFAKHYRCGEEVFPDLNKLTTDCLQIVKLGGLVGVLDLKWPQPGKNAQEVFVSGVSTGRNSLMRVFSAWKLRIH